MKKKVHGKWRKYIITLMILAIIFFVWFYVLPILWFVVTAESYTDLVIFGNIHNPKIQKVMETERYIFKYPEDDTETLSYLKLAHAITLKYIKYKWYDHGTNFKGAEQLINEKTKNEEYKLEHGFGVCIDFTTYTLSNLKYLLKKQGRLELISNVRLAGGIVFDPKTKEGGEHSWLELKQGDSWIIYETTIEKEINEIRPKEIHSIIEDKEVFIHLYSKSLCYRKLNHTSMNNKGGFKTKGFYWRALLMPKKILKYRTK